MSISEELLKILTEKEESVRKTSSYNHWKTLFKFLEENQYIKKSDYTIPALDVMEKKVRESLTHQIKQQSNFD